MLPWYSKLTCHLIFEIKLGENFRRKARFLADGHKHPVKLSLSYSTVVSRDSVRIAFLLAALNSVEVLSCDIQNAYLSAPCRKKFYHVTGNEFGLEKGKVFIVKRALYDLRTSGAAFRTFLAESFHDMGFKHCNMADPDVWIRANRKPNGDKYYEYFLAYVDDLLLISHDAKAGIMELLQQPNIVFKNDAYAPPETFLGSQMEYKKINGLPIRTQHSQKYVKAALQTMEEVVSTREFKLPTAVRTPFSTKYSPELDVTSELDDNDTRLCQEW